MTWTNSGESRSGGVCDLVESMTYAPWRPSIPPKTVSNPAEPTSLFKELRFRRFRTFILWIRKWYATRIVGAVITRSTAEQSRGSCTLQGRLLGFSPAPAVLMLTQRVRGSWLKRGGGMPMARGASSNPGIGFEPLLCSLIVACIACAKNTVMSATACGML